MNSKPNLIYREINPSDFPEVLTFILQHELSYVDSTPGATLEAESVREIKAKTLMEKLALGDRVYCCLAVFDGPRMIGSHYLHRYEIDQEPACHIHGLWVHADYRKLGIASRLKSDGEAWARALGCKLMDTNVRVSNRKMVALNEKLGYEVARVNFRKRLD